MSAYLRGSNRPEPRRNSPFPKSTEQTEPAQKAQVIAVQEAWEAAGGNPGIKATKAELLASLRLLDAVCDEADTQEGQRRAQGVPSGGANVFQTMTPGAKEALARLERVACLQATAMHNEDIHHIRLYLIAQQRAAAPQAERQIAAAKGQGEQGREELIDLAREDVQRLIEWFEAVEDLNSLYLESRDRALVDRLKQAIKSPCKPTLRRP